MKELYYTVEKDLQGINGIEECTGNKQITAYIVSNNLLQEFFTIKLSNEESSKYAVLEFLEEQGYKKDDWKLQLL